MTLAGKQAAIMVANGFEETQMAEIHRALLKADIKVKTISTEQGLVNSWHGVAWGHYFPVDKQLGEILAADLDILVIPGGSRSIAKLKQSMHTKRLITHCIDGGKPMVVFGEGVELLAHCDRARGHTLAAAPGALADAIRLAGGFAESEQNSWVDGAIITMAGTEAGVNWASWVVTQLSAIDTASLAQAAA